MHPATGRSGQVNMSLRASIITHEELVATLRWLADAIEEGDSWEGFLRYSTLSDDDGNVIDGHGFAVAASLRIGNRDGQGGYRMIGDPLS